MLTHILIICEVGLYLCIDFTFVYDGSKGVN